MLFFFFASCKKETDFTKTASYKNIIYEIQNNVDSLKITYRIGVYITDTTKGNIDHDSLFTTKGNFFINASVLLGEKVIFTGISFTGGNFHLKIKDTSGLVLVETDTVTHFPANQAHRDEYESQIQFTPN